MKPYNLYGAPPVRIELKWAERTSGRPNRFDHFKVASRVRSGPNNNFEKLEEVHKIIGDEPKRVPIVLMCDDPMENFSLFRGFWNQKGDLGCGAPYGAEIARRFFKVNQDKSVEKIPEGYEVKCSAECKYWQQEKKGCTLSGSLFFKLRDLPYAEEFGVARIKGANAQRRTLSSLNILHQLTGGILANLPLVAVFHQETMKDKNGRSNPIPLISVQHEGSQHEFMEAVAKEWRRRAELYEIRHGRPHGSQEDLIIKDVLSSIADREAMVEMGDGEAEFISEENTHPLFEGTSIPQRKQETLLYRATKDGEVDEEALKEMIEAEYDVGF